MIKVSEIRCQHCEQWFESPIGFGELENFDKSTLSGNQVQCPECQRMTGCNKNNMRVRSKQGGFRGNDTY